MHTNHVWSYDFVSAKTYDGRTVRMLNLIDEHSRECLMVRCERRWSSAKVIEALADVMVMKGVPEHLRSDNGPEFVAHDLRQWLANTGAKTSYIEPGSPWENGYCESFNSKLRDEFLNGELSYSMKEIRVLAERWRIHFNTVRPHSSLGYRPPAPEAWQRSPGRKGWHSLRSCHPFRPPPATIRNKKSLRYTNKQSGSKDRAGHRGYDAPERQWILR
jgi:putative transposase